MKNKLTDLNDHLFAALERVNDEDLDDEKLKNAIDRARSVANLGREIVQNARVVLSAAVFTRESLPSDDVKLPTFISGKPKLEALDGSKKG